MKNPDKSPESLGTQRQLEIYMAGLRGQKPVQPVSVEELELRAKEVMTPEAYAYVACGAGSEQTLRANREAFNRWSIVPRLLQNGVDGMVVSNHGGRQLDGAPAALDALPVVVDAVAGRAAVLFDSGIRRGADVFKAMALGAQAVLLGRPYCYGLAVGGEQGVRDVVNNLLADLDLTLGLAGCTSFQEVSRKNLQCRERQRRELQCREPRER